MPKPNGYDDFVKAGKMLTKKASDRWDLSDYRKMGAEELRVLVWTNAEALKIARNALDRQCRMPIRYSNDSFRAYMGEGSSFFSLAFAFCAAGRLAQLEGRTNDAVVIYLDLVRFAHKSRQGGLITDAAGAMTSEALGLEDLKKLRNSLVVMRCCQIAKTLEEIDAHRQPWREFLNQETAFNRQAYGWVEQLDLLFSSESRKTIKNFEAKFYAADQRRRQTIVEFAAHAYELEKGQRPKSLADLVPDYLKVVPKDPVTGTNLVYTP